MTTHEYFSPYKVNIYDNGKINNIKEELFSKIPKSAVLIK